MYLIIGAKYSLTGGINEDSQIDQNSGLWSGIAEG